MKGLSVKPIKGDAVLFWSMVRSFFLPFEPKQKKKKNALSDHLRKHCCTMLPFQESPAIP